MSFTVALQTVVDVVWGLPLVVFIFSANIYLAWLSKLSPLRSVLVALKLLRKTEKSEDEGQIPHFKTFCNAIAATVGLGNISGVAIAISQGGPGVVLWMWVAAIFGMNTKFFECTAAMLFRGKDHFGHTQGGAMYAIERALPKRWHWLATLFATCGLVGTLSMFQINQLSTFLSASYAVPVWLCGLGFALVTLWVLQGGLQRISAACALIVPVMSVVYVGVCLGVLAKNLEHLPQIIREIWVHAFTAKSALYGTVSYGLIQIMVTGIKRATFSNEAGLGTAPMAHANSSTKEPAAEGLVAMLGPFVDTIVVCTLTALVILVSFRTGGIPDVSGIELTTQAFASQLGDWGRHFLGVSILLFAYSTILGMANYNEKCWTYLFAGRPWFGRRTFRAWYGLSIFAGSLLAATNVINIIDIAYALMTIPNIIVTVVVAPSVVRELRSYKRRRTP